MAQRQFRGDDTSTWSDRFGGGGDGALTVASNTTDSTANTTLSASSGVTSATAGSGTGFAAGNLILIHQSRNGGAGAGNWELNKISSTGSGTNWTLAYPTIQAYDTTAQAYLLKQYTTVTINSGVTLTGSSWDGTTNKFGGILALLASTSITVTGNLALNGGNGTNGTPGQGSTVGGYAGGNGRGGTNNITSNCGEGTGGATAQQTSANGNGGGGASVLGSPSEPGGGGGGDGTAGGTGNNSINGGVGGTGGGTAGNAGLTVMVFGGGGGGECHEDSSTCGGGGAGGGIIILIAPTITVTGTIAANGGNPGGQGAGGGGGSVLFKGQNITLGSSLVTASAGSASSNGGAGGVGRIHADYSQNISGTTSPGLDSRQDSVYNTPAVVAPTGISAFFM